MPIEEVEWESLEKAIPKVDQKKPKKHNWLKRDHRGYFFEITIKDETNRKIDRFVWNTKEGFKSIVEILKMKYGM